MKLREKLYNYFKRPFADPKVGEPQMIAHGWDDYAKRWKPENFHTLPGHNVLYLGDEWTSEDISGGGTTYGLPPDIIAAFENYLNKFLIAPYLPAFANEGLEIGPGGGRLTALLLSMTKLLHLAEPSKAMIAHLEIRFKEIKNLRYYHTDGMNLPKLQPISLDYIISFDVFVHFEPRLIYRYLQKIAALLKPGGIGIVHYANSLTPIGWQQFQADLEGNILQRTSFSCFGVMCPELMEGFLRKLELRVISSDIGIIPRDAIAVFQKV